MIKTKFTKEKTKIIPRKNQKLLPSKYQLPFPAKLSLTTRNKSPNNKRLINAEKTRVIV